jgi:two-component system sensor histidine kinase DegS
MITQLRPAILEDFGLLPALRHLASQSTPSGASISVVGPDEAPRPPPQVEAALFRAAQETLSNAVKHAAASRIAMTLRVREGRAALFVSDDGLGFDYRELRRVGKKGRWGLLMMRERIEGIGGRLAIRAAPGRGTLVAIRWRARSANPDSGGR